MRTVKDAERVVFIGDVHVPYHDLRAVAAALAFVKWFRPHQLYLIGDIADFYSISKFAKKPKSPDMADELSQTADLLDTFRKVAPRTCRRYYIEGNHEDRLRQWVCGQGAQFYDLLSLPKLLKLEERGYAHCGYGDGFEVGKTRFLARHGEKISQFAGHSAKAEHTIHDGSGISGHSHRMGMFRRTTRLAEYQWYENGCLCRLDPEWVAGVPNWQHGFHAGYHRGTDIEVEPVKYIGSRAFFVDAKGRVFSG